MSNSKYNPFWIKFDGTPKGGQIPCRTIVNGPALTKKQQAEVDQNYFLFCLEKQATLGDYFVRTRKLSDGSKLRIVSQFGTDTIQVWTSGRRVAFDIYPRLVLSDEHNPIGVPFRWHNPPFKNDEYAFNIKLGDRMPVGNIDWSDRREDTPHKGLVLSWFANRTGRYGVKGGGSYPEDIEEDVAVSYTPRGRLGMDAAAKVGTTPNNRLHCNGVEIASFEGPIESACLTTVEGDGSGGAKTVCRVLLLGEGSTLKCVQIPFSNPIKHPVYPISAAESPEKFSVLWEETVPVLHGPTHCNSSGTKAIYYNQGPGVVGIKEIDLATGEMSPVPMPNNWFGAESVDKETLRFSLNAEPTPEPVPLESLAKGALNFSYEGSVTNHEYRVDRRFVLAIDYVVDTPVYIVAMTSNVTNENQSGRGDSVYNTRAVSSELPLVYTSYNSVFTSQFSIHKSENFSYEIYHSTKGVIHSSSTSSTYSKQCSSVFTQDYVGDDDGEVYDATLSATGSTNAAGVVKELYGARVHGDLRVGLFDIIIEEVSSDRGESGSFNASLSLAGSPKRPEERTTTCSVSVTGADSNISAEQTHRVFGIDSLGAKVLIRTAQGGSWSKSEENDYITFGGDNPNLFPKRSQFVHPFQELALWNREDYLGQGSLTDIPCLQLYGMSDYMDFKFGWPAAAKGRWVYLIDRYFPVYSMRSGGPTTYTYQWQASRNMPADTRGLTQNNTDPLVEGQLYKSYWSPDDSTHPSLSFHVLGYGYPNGEWEAINNTPLEVEQSYGHSDFLATSFGYTSSFDNKLAFRAISVLKGPPLPGTNDYSLSAFETQSHIIDLETLEMIDMKEYIPQMNEELSEGGEPLTGLWATPNSMMFFGPVFDENGRYNKPPMFYKKDTP